MRTKLFPTLLCFVSVLLMAPAFAQVTITLPKHQFKQHEQIDVAITNESQQAVSFCVEFGHWSYKGEGESLETTPTPMLVEKHANKRWSVLMIGPDMGSSRHPVVLQPKETQRYPFRLTETGTMRMVLRYWSGETGDMCVNTAGSKTVTSKAFLVN